MTPYLWITSALELSGSKARGGMWQCPSHEDGSPSLSVNQAPNGAALMKCFGGCSTLDVLHALEVPKTCLTTTPTLSPGDVGKYRNRFPVYPPLTHSTGNSKAPKGAYDSVEFHEYTTKVRLVRYRYGGKKRCKWEAKGGDGWWYTSKNLDLKSLPLYREHEVHAAKAFETEVILCESESSVDALVKEGLVATTWAGGAANVPFETVRRVLAGSQILWVPDNDNAGMNCSRRMEPILEAVTKSLRVIVPPTGKDARDLLLDGGSKVFTQLDVDNVDALASFS